MRKVVTITGIQLQFDTHNEDASNKIIGEQILLINELLSTSFENDGQPQIMLTKNSKITIIEPNDNNN